jgi:membrane protein
VSWGGAVGAVTWLLGSAAISWYFEHIANYGWLYGSLGTVLSFITWAWFSSAAVLFGTTLNAEIEQWKWPAQPTEQQPRCPRFTDTPAADC